MGKNSMVLYTDYMEQLELLSLEQRGMLLTALMLYQKTGDIIEMDGMTMMAFSFIKSQIDRDNAKYDETVQKRREAGRRGGTSPNKQTEAKEANAHFAYQTEAKEANASDNDNVNVNDNVNDNVNVVCLSNQVDLKDIDPERQTTTDDDAFQFSNLEKTYGLVLSRKAKSTIQFLVKKGLTWRLIDYAFERSREYGAKTWIYTQKILFEYLQNGVYTVMSAENYHRGRAAPDNGGSWEQDGIDRFKGGVRPYKPKPQPSDIYIPKDEMERLQRQAANQEVG